MTGYMQKTMQIIIIREVVDSSKYCECESAVYGWGV